MKAPAIALYRPKRGWRASIPAALTGTTRIIPLHGRMAPRLYCLAAMLVWCQGAEPSRHADKTSFRGSNESLITPLLAGPALSLHLIGHYHRASPLLIHFLGFRNSDIPAARHSMCILR